jgi:hypothetical protein
MRTRECYLWLRQRRERLEPVHRPSIPVELLIQEEDRRCARIGLLLTQNYELPESSAPDALDNYLIHERLQFSEKLLCIMMLPYSPCRVRDWSKKRYLWWLLGVSWQLIGVEQWRERERMRVAFPPDVYAE